MSVVEEKGLPVISRKSCLSVKWFGPTAFYSVWKFTPSSRPVPIAPGGGIMFKKGKSAGGHEVRMGEDVGTPLHEENVQKTRYLILGISEGQNWEPGSNPVFTGSHSRCGACFVTVLPAVME